MAKAATRTLFTVASINGKRLRKPKSVWARSRREAEEKIAHGRRI